MQDLFTIACQNKLNVLNSYNIREATVNSTCKTIFQHKDSVKKSSLNILNLTTPKAVKMTSSVLSKHYIYPILKANSL